MRYTFDNIRHVYLNMYVEYSYNLQYNNFGDYCRLLGGFCFRFTNLSEFYADVCDQKRFLKFALDRNITPTEYND